YRIYILDDIEGFDVTECSTQLEEPKFKDFLNSLSNRFLLIIFFIFNVASFLWLWYSSSNCIK
ncbi:hypothetical protein ACFL5B_03580, partial [Candidatus Latescibacterota bacterium]